MTLDSPRRRGPLAADRRLALAVLVVLVLAGAASLAQTAQGQEASTSITFAALFARASYGGPETSYNTAAVMNADLNMLLSTNVRCIRIDIGYAPWLQNDKTAINEITSLVQQIKSAGKCLIIADAASESYRNGGQLTWSQFLAAWVPRVSTLAALYQPDYYVVIKEPGWYVPMVSGAATNPQFASVDVWMSLTKNLTDAVHAVSPSTQVGVAIAANSLTQANGAFFVQYLNKVQTIPGIAFIGFDTYGQSDQTATQNYLAANPPSKAVWLPEVWSTATGSPLDGSPSQDAAWLRSLYTFAAAIHVTVCIPFYTDHFASYSLGASSPTDPAQIISLYLQRTPIFSEFQSVIAAAGGASTTYSSSGALTSLSSGASLSSSTASSTTGSGTSHLTSLTSTPAVSGGGNGSVSLRIVALAVVALVVLVGVVIYFSRRRN